MASAGSYTLSWKSKNFEVSAEQILTYSGFNASHSFQTEEKKNGKEMPKTKEIAPGIGSLSFDVALSILKGNNVKEEYKWWTEKCEAGEYSEIYMGGDKFGSYKWRVNRVDIRDLITIDNGEVWKSCTLSIGFEEYYVKVRLTKAEKRAKKLQKKAERQLEKALSAKNEKARQKAIAKAASLQKQFNEASVEAAKARAERIQQTRDTINAINEAAK